MNFSNLKALAKQFYIISKEGTHQTLIDLKYLIQTKNLFKSLQRVEAKNSIEFHEIRLKKKDAFKIIPFGILIALPFSSVLVFPYIYFMPNGIPRNYMKFFLAERSNSIKFLRREKSYNFLLNKKEPKKYDALILTNYANFMLLEYISFSYFFNQMYALLAKFIIFMASKIKNDVSSLNNHWILKHEFDFNFFPIEIFRRKIISFQLINYIRHLIKEDSFLNNDDLDTRKYPTSTLKEYLKERGYNSDNWDEKTIQEKFLQWKEILKNTKIENEYFYMDLCLKNFKI